MTISIRSANPETDYQRVAELLSIETSDLMTMDELIEEDEDMLPGDIRHHLVATDTSGQIVGYGSATRKRIEPAGYFHLTVLIDEAERRQGIGSALYDEILAFVQDNDATTLFCTVRERNADCLVFGEERGFRIRNQMFMSKIDLNAFDESQFAGLISSVEATGIRFSSLAREGNTDHAREQLYEINRIASIDDPASTDDLFDPFEDYENYILDASWFQPEGQFMAFDGDRAVGMSGISYSQEANTMFTLLTGVAPEYRGRKIAQALKLIAILHGKGLGADSIRTQNDSINAPMLAINRKLGFVREDGLGHYGLVKELANGE